MGQINPNNKNKSIRSWAYIFPQCYLSHWGFPSGAVVKYWPANAGDERDTGSMPRSGRSPGGRNGNLFQYSCLGNPMKRGACWLQSIGSQWVGHDWACTHTHTHIGNYYITGKKNDDIIRVVTGRKRSDISPLYIPWCIWKETISRDNFFALQMLNQRITIVSWSHFCVG